MYFSFFRGGTNFCKLLKIKYRFAVLSFSVCTVKILTDFSKLDYKYIYISELHESLSGTKATSIILQNCTFRFADYTHTILH